eukprot:TRINITY_DN13926_c0_g1_i1.p1 TRINITY_DN13926_c0_g1~~TRINITY_DN13926_c0_g1_i1.p1  ORF type:complete len:499 (-),score=119.74 TRINITY_DN13926_c0_g1_i1:209-1705(-)
MPQVSEAELASFKTYVSAGHTDVKWRKQQLETLRQAMIDEKENMLEMIGKELGTAAAEAQLMQVASTFGEIDVCLDNLEEWAKPQYVSTPLVLQPATSYVQAQPKGCVLILGAWNYPFNITLGPVATALAAGNTIVVKPSELTPGCGGIIKKMLDRLDQKGVKCVEGGPDVAAGLIEMKFDHIFYTGGPRIGKLVMAAAAPNLVPVTLELGGKSPVVVAEGTNIKEACRRIATQKFTNTGQTCIAPDYVLVEKTVSQQFSSTMVDTVKAMLTEHPESAEHVGRIVNQRGADRLLGYLAEAHGGKVLVGGAKPADLKVSRDADRYVPPTVVLDPKKDSKLLEEEIFGPILSIVTVTSVDEAISFINDRPKPLALYVFAPNNVADKVLSHTSSGGAVVGDVIIHKGNVELPFGGIGNSGMGRNHGIHGFRELSHLRGVMRRPLFPPSPLALPVDNTVSSVAYLYASSRPGRFLKKHFWKLLALFLALVFSKRLAARSLKR